MKRVLFTALLTLACSVSLAQDLLITGANLHSQSDAGVIENTDILIKDGRIAKIAPRIPTNKMIKVINANGRPVTPALFAGLTVSGLSEVEAVSEAVDSGYRELYTELMHPEFDVRLAYNPHSSVIPITRVEGFGFTLLGARGSDKTLSGQGGMVRFDGGYSSFEGKPVIYVQTSGRAAGSMGGSKVAHWMLLNQAFNEALTDEELTLITPQGAATLKTAKSDGIFLFHADRAADIMRVLAFAKEQGISIVIHGGSEAWMVADSLAAAQVAVILNPLKNLPESFESLGARLDNAALLHEAGVPVIFSSGETHNARKVRQLAGNAAANGLPHNVALAAISSTPAEVFGGEPRSIGKGSRADLVIWSGDPLEVTTQAQQVILGGIPDTMVSRQTLLRDRYMDAATDMPRAYTHP